MEPGFFDGIAPPETYRWISPPPSLAAGNRPPLPGRHSVAGPAVSQAGIATTRDGQVIFSYVAGSFEGPPASLVIDIEPVTEFPPPGGLRLATNVYRVRSSSPLAKSAVVNLRFADQLAAPDAVYFSPEGGTSWSRLPPTESVFPYTISAVTDQFGLFVAAYQPRTPRAAATSGGITMPIVVLLAAVILAVSGLPLLALSRRSAGDASDPDEGDVDTPEKHV